MQQSYTDALEEAGNELAIEIATTPQQVLEAQRLRYTVYCEERDFLPGNKGLEADEFDEHSQHILVRSRRDGKAYGTVRVVLPRLTAETSFPMQKVCSRSVFRSLPFQTTAEISRFAVTRDRGTLSPAASALMRLALIRGIVQVSRDCGLTHWCATMERTLLRLLGTTAIYFRPLGEPIEYHGLRQPAAWNLRDGFAQIRSKHPQIWAFLTDNGALLAGGAAEDVALSAAA